MLDFFYHKKLCFLKLLLEVCLYVLLVDSLWCIFRAFAPTKTNQPTPNGSSVSQAIVWMLQPSSIKRDQYLVFARDIPIKLGKNIAN